MSAVVEEVKRSEPDAEAIEHRPASDNPCKELTKEFTLYRDQIRGYLERIRADLEEFKFSVEKNGEGVEVAVEIKAFVHPVNRAQFTTP